MYAYTVTHRHTSTDGRTETHTVTQAWTQPMIS